MTKYRDNLPQLSDEIFLSDGGLETTMIFLKGIDLPYFASIDLLNSQEGYEALINYYVDYIKIAKKFKTNFILESPTWRSSKDWIEKLEYAPNSFEILNKKAISLMEKLRNQFEDEDSKMVISGCIGPRGDGYKAENKMTFAEALEYHNAQIKLYSETNADMVTAITMNYLEEAVGIALAAKNNNIPVAISFTVETDGKLPDGHTLKDAIKITDEMTEDYPAYYMINCAHTTHFMNELNTKENEDWISRIKGIRANASKKSHAELDESTELDRGDLDELSSHYSELHKMFPHINVFGGCCGTDHEHIHQIAEKI